MNDAIAPGTGAVPDELLAEETDESLVAQAQQGDERSLMLLLNRHKTTVRIKARSYFLIGADHEDLVQEGMIGLYKAIRDYKPDRQASFRAFADLCIKRQIISAIKTATRQKHMPLNSYVSLNKPVYDEENDRTLLDVIEGAVTNPEELYINKEDMLHMEAALDTLLSSFERQVLSVFLDGKSYQEIAALLGRHTKGVDNALQRIKKKTLKYLEAHRQ